ncbi:1-acyl-sn-glycerol-3-phosphate acyltransferase [Lacinutrix sp. C3R15]|uniref:lysophospholipid acyltransferase family protein n=1 Tax=Flavobacteriaceae TaxID=49546 RepID=UPI001C0837D4|nr:MULTISPECIES: lysophospholipid acyltransferase family protein [Flavobacteriaceae]MBU2938147.1 1-acyl-sn-glycerol-3-phosphate acyltransferase [Lacinutrix sp. C3R15]MDO6621461.1 lysophospholipid acyltransferase family protein [Oceanihabitans sp. 1_MG-2023]
MRKLLAYPLTCIYYLFFGMSLLIFHPIQWFCFNVLGYQAHKKSVDALQFCLMRCINLLGSRHSFYNAYNIDTSQPVIIVSNHQSMADIPPLMWYFRKHHVKFVSKKELGKGIPSVSYNLRHGGSVLIDRKNARQSIVAIRKFADYIKSTNRAAVIFPEGTRSRDGKPKPFRTKGLETLIKYIPNAVIIPVTINNSWKNLCYGKFPLGIGNHLTFTAHKPVKLGDFESKELLIKHIESTIINSIKI